MKRGARQGLWFRVPVGDGRAALGVVTADRGRRCAAAFYDSERRELWSGWLFDTGLAHERWHAAEPVADVEPPPAPPPAQPLDSASVERLLAARLDGNAGERARYVVRDVRPPLNWNELDRLPDGARLQWRDPLMRDDLARVDAWLRARPGASIRLYGGAAENLRDVAEWPSLTRLSLEASQLADLPSMPHVRELELDGCGPDFARAARAFSNVASLRVMAPVTIDAPAFASLPALVRLALVDVALENPGALFRVPNIRALSLCRVRGIRSLAALVEHPNLRVLALDGLLHVDDLRPLQRIPHLESLDVRGMWQFGVDDVAFVTEMPALRRLHLDIGGRRKNVETYKKRGFAAPLPF